MFGARRFTQTAGRRRSAGDKEDAEAPAPTAATLRARAVGWMARREHSRAELRQKLRRLGGAEADIESLLDTLEQERLLSDQRYAEGVARVRAARFGSQRVANELRQKGVGAEVAGLVADLKAGDLDLAQSVWARKFGVAPTDAAERARQMRFLQARGFPGDVIRKVVPKSGLPDDRLQDDQ